MRTLKTSEAAAVLNVSPNTLRAWERRFGYPKPQRSPGKHRLYTHGEVAALRDALQEGLSISSAVSRAREALSADTSILVGALVLLRARPRRRRDGGRAGAALRRALGRGGPAPSLTRSASSTASTARRGPSPPSGRTTGSSAPSAWRRRRCARRPSSSATPRATSSTPTRCAALAAAVLRCAPARACWCCPSAASPASSDVIGASGRRSS